MNYHRYLTYDPVTGELRYKPRPVSDFGSERAWKISQTKCAGKVAGYFSFKKRKSGVVRDKVIFMLDGKMLQAHRVIWEMVHGPIPKGMTIDHVDRNPWNNKLDNLRLATYSQNLCNRGIQSNNTSGHTGVFFHRKKGIWQAVVKVRGKAHSLGYYKCASAASIVRDVVAARMHGEFVRTNR